MNACSSPGAATVGSPHHQRCQGLAAQKLFIHVQLILDAEHSDLRLVTGFEVDSLAPTIINPACPGQWLQDVAVPSTCTSLKCSNPPLHGSSP